MLAEESHHTVAVVEIDQATANIVAGVPPRSLMGTFGDAEPVRSQRVNTGDSVQITLWEAAPGGLFTSPATDPAGTGGRSAMIPEQIVSQDGAITVPFAGRVPVAGRTPPDIEREIVARLATKAIDPQVLVTIPHNGSNTVTVMGDVTTGSRIPLGVRGDRLFDVIATTGGARVPAQDVVVSLTRHGRTVRVPMQAVIDDPRENIFLQSDDVVTLTREAQTFTAMGAIAHSGVIPFETRVLTLDEALGKAGDLLDDRADPDGLFILRYEQPDVAQVLPQAHGIPTHDGWTPTIYHLNMRDPTALLLARLFPIRNKDILYVSSAGLSDLRKVLSLVNLLVSPAVTAVDVNATVR